MSRQNETKKTPDQKLTDLVNKMMQQMHIADKIGSRKTSGDELEEAFGDGIRIKLHVMSSAKRGRIADFGAGGRAIIVELALGVVVARMFDLLLEGQTQQRAVPDDVLPTGRRFRKPAYVRSMTSRVQPKDGSRGELHGPRNPSTK